MRKKRFGKLIGAMIDEQTHQWLVQVTDEQQITISKYVRKMLQEKVNETGGQNHDDQ